MTQRILKVGYLERRAFVWLWKRVTNNPHADRTTV
jgi:hypothetical protein